MADERIQALARQVDQLYLPTPAQAERHRRQLVVQPPEQQSQVDVTPIDQIGGGVLTRVYESPVLDTKGWTLQSAQVAVTVRADTGLDEAVPVGLRIVLGLEGANNSAFCTITRVAFGAYRGLGYYPLPIAVSPNSLAREIRFAVLMGLENPDDVARPDRFVRFDVDGVLAAGYRF